VASDGDAPCSRSPAIPISSPESRGEVPIALAIGVRFG
jgi:hypothetical protein